MVDVSTRVTCSSENNSRSRTHSSSNRYSQHYRRTLQAVSQRVDDVCLRRDSGQKKKELSLRPKPHWVKVERKLRATRRVNRKSAAGFLVKSFLHNVGQAKHIRFMPGNQGHERTIRRALASTWGASHSSTDTGRLPLLDGIVL